MTFILGLTGGICTGKSTLSAYLKQRGALIIDADQIAREVVAPKTVGLAAIKEQFGADFIKNDGTLNRAKLAQLVFSDAKQLAKLDLLTQPLIRQAILQQLTDAKKQQVSLVVLDAPLLLEKNYQSLCDAVMVLALPETIQIERLEKRDGLTTTQAKQRLANQMPTAQKVKWADIVIDTSHSPAFTQQQVNQWLDLNKLLK